MRPHNTSLLFPYFSSTVFFSFLPSVWSKSSDLYAHFVAITITSMLPFCCQIYISNVLFSHSLSPPFLLCPSHPRSLHPSRLLPPSLFLLLSLYRQHLDYRDLPDVVPVTLRKVRTCVRAAVRYCTLGASFLYGTSCSLVSCFVLSCSVLLCLCELDELYERERERKRERRR